MRLWGKKRELKRLFYMIHEKREVVTTLKCSHKEVLLGLKKEVGESRRLQRFH